MAWTPPKSQPSSRDCLKEVSEIAKNSGTIPTQARGHRPAFGKIRIQIMEDMRVSDIFFMVPGPYQQKIFLKTIIPYGQLLEKSKMKRHQLDPFQLVPFQGECFTYRIGFTTGEAKKTD